MKKVLFFITLILMLAVFMVVSAFYFACHPPVAKAQTNEIIEKRTENSKTYFLGYTDDGRARYSVNATLNIIHYKDNPEDEYELWKDINTEISVDGKVTTAPYDLEVYLEGLPGFHFKSKTSGEFDVRLKEARQDSTSISPIPYDSKVKPVIQGNQVIWRDLYPDVDVVLTAFNTGVMLNRIIKSPDSPLEYDVGIKEIAKGQSQLMPLRPAEDANGQLIKMEGKPLKDGRTETLKLEVLEQEGIEIKPIKFPIADASVIDEQVGAGADDGFIYNSSFNNSFNNISAGRNWGSIRKSFIRFTTVNIPQGCTIDVAFVTFISNGSRSATCNVIWYGNNVDSAVAPTSVAQYNALVKTDAYVTDSPPAWSAGGSYQQPSIVSIIQEIIDRPGWVANNDMQLLWQDNGSPDSAQNVRDPGSQEWGYPSHLYIEYTEGGGEPTVTNTPTNKAWGIVNLGQTSETAMDFFVLHNTGTVAADIEIQGTDFTGGDDTWDLSDDASVGDNVYGLKAGLDDDDDLFDIIVGEASATELKNNLTANSTQSWGLKIYMPSAVTGYDNQEMTATITLIISAH